MKIKWIFLLQFTLFANLLSAQVQLDNSTQKTVVKNLCNSLNKNYVYPDKAKLISDFITLNDNNGKYDSTNNQNKFANQLSADIRTISKDRHIRVVYDTELEADIVKYLTSKKNANKISEADIAKEEIKNFHFKKLEILPANIGYIELNGFALPGKSTSNTIFSAMRFVAHTDAVILDLRNNFGGNPVVANEILSYFFADKQYIGRSYNRIEDKWTEQYVGNRFKIEKDFVLKMPVYILTSKRTFSAAEGLSYCMQQLKKAIIVGDTTRGGAHLTRSFSLGNGYVAFIPFSRGENAVTKTDWEGIGVIPDIAVKENNALIEAQMHFLKAKLLAQTTEEEKRKISYVINYLMSKKNIPLPQKELIDLFLGNYEYFTVRYLNNQLLFMDTKNHKEPIVMIPVSDKIYQIGLDYQVEFKLNDRGECDSFQMYWDDGWTEVIKKNG